jgi:hypothetical protein
MLIISAAGCKKEEKVITADDVEVNTILAKADGSLQVATVEDFDKPYYTLAELSEYVTNEVNLYNKNAGGEKVKIDGLKINDKKAIMVLSYTGMDQYSNFNNVIAAYFNGGAGNVKLDMPATLVDVKNKATANTNEVIQNDKYKVLVMYEPYDIMVDGKVVYYSDNATLVDKSSVQGTGEGATVVVYKP